MALFNTMHSQSLIVNCTFYQGGVQITDHSRPSAVNEPPFPLLPTPSGKTQGKPSQPGPVTHCSLLSMVTHPFVVVTANKITINFNRPCSHAAVAGKVPVMFQNAFLPQVSGSVIVVVKRILLYWYLCCLFVVLPPKYKSCKC